jgi:DNA-binding transcriptional LysR family regulator
MPRATVFTFSLPMREALVCAGRFIATVPGFLMRSPLKHPSLRQLPVELPGTRNPISIVTLKNRALSPVAELFIDRVRGVAKQFVKGNELAARGAAEQKLTPAPRSPAGTHAAARRRSP